MGKPPRELEPTYCTNEVCGRLRVGRKKLRALARELRLPVMKPGKTRVYTWDQVQALEALSVRKCAVGDPALPEAADVPPRRAVDALRAARARHTKRRYGPLRLAPPASAGNVVALRLEKAD